MSVEPDPSERPTAPPMPPRSVLPAGIHGWWWPGNGGWGDPTAEIASAVDQGFRGLIPQNGLGATLVCEQHGDAMRDAGLFVACGLGLDGTDADAAAIVRAILRGLDAADAVMLDWESPRRWETPAGHALASAIVDGVLTARPAALGRVTDCPWRAPLYLLSGTVRHPTHPGAPTAIFGKLCAFDRYTQDYGCAAMAANGQPAEPIANATGRSTRMLAWSRDPSQYAAIAASAGVAPWTIRPAFEMYRRTVADHVTSMLAEPVVALWDRQEADARAVTGVRVVKKLRALDFDGADGVAAFQRAAGLSADGVVGAKTCAALGLPWPG